MEVLSLMAVMGIDTSKYESGLNKATGQAQNFASKLGTILKGVAIGKALFDVGKGAVDAYKDYEQLVGGIDTLFKSSSAKVQAYAHEAFQNAGMSANEYMSTAISFSSSLINSLGGDTEKAAEQTNKAITDMSDNANKMGTSLEMVQNAYRGFARGNFTMLDNLSLGYSGTKEGMEELLAKAHELSGVEYDISSLSDIIDAIHEVQASMDITGTTIAEAMDTIEGSANAAKAAWQNVLTAIAGGGDMGQAINGLITSLFGNGSGGFVNNLTTRVVEVVKGIAEFVGKSAPLFAKQIPKLLVGVGKSLVTSLPKMIGSLAKAIPDTLGNLITSFDDAFLDLIGASVDKTTESYQNIKSLIEKGIKAAVKIEPDDGSAVFTKADEIIETLKTDKYKGTLTIDGDTGAADTALENLQAAIRKFKDGGDIAELQKAIEDCEKLTVSPELSPEAKEAVQQQLDILMGTLKEMTKLAVVMSATAGSVYTDAKGIIEKLKGDEYKGKIEIDGNTQKANDALSALETEITTLTQEGGSVATLQAAIAECQKIEISPEYKDDTDVQGQIDTLKATLENMKELPITFTGDGKQALEEAGSTVDKINEYKGLITIDGKADGVDTALSDIRAAITKLQSGEGSIGELEAAINRCKELTIDPNVDPTKKDEALAALKELEDALGKASGEATITYSATGTTDTGWTEFKSFVDSQGWKGKDFTYKATGEFTVSEGTTDQIKKYAEAISAAASAIGDYNEAVNGIKSAAEQKLKADLESIDQQASQEYKELSLLHTHGHLTDKEYEERLGNLTENVQGQKQALTDEYNQIVKTSEKLANGTAKDDMKATGELLDNLYKDEEISAETYESAIANLTNGTAPDNAKTSGSLALEYLTNKANETNEMIDKAVGDYNTAMDAAEAQQAEATQTQEMIDSFAAPFKELASDMAGTGDERFNTTENSMEDIRAAIVDAIKFNKEYQEIDEGVDTQALADLMMSVLYDEDNNPQEINMEEFEAAAAEILEEMKASAQDTADAAKQEAETALQEALKNAAENNNMTFENIETLISKIEESGIEIDENTKALILNVESAAETAASEATTNVEKSLETINGLNDLVSTGISEGGTSGSAEMGTAMSTEGESAAGKISTALDTAIGKARRLNIKGAGGMNFEFNSKAMSGGRILQGLTPFGIDGNGVVQYGGEAGAEAVVGVNSLDHMIQESVRSAIGAVLGKMDQIIGGQNQGDVKIVMDSGAMVGQLVKGMDRQLGSTVRRRGGGRT